MPELVMTQSGLAKVAGSVPASTQGTTITSGGSVNTKGSSVEVISATVNDANWVLVHLGNVNGNSTYLVDIAIGAATEQIILPDLYAAGRAAGGNMGSYLFPIFIPAGSRLTARCQANNATQTIEVALNLFSGTMLAGGSQPSIVSAYGSVTQSVGTNIDPGAVAHTDSAWTQLTAATDRDHCWFCVAARFGSAALGAVARWLIDIGIGAATEAEIISDLYYTADVTSDFPYGPVRCFPYYVPAGSRLTARARSLSATDVDRDIWIKLYGV
jgi:hypothetical protein